MRILHTADNHLGVRQYGLQARQEDFSRALFQVVTIARERNADILTFGGDQFHSSYPPASAVTDLRDAVSAFGRPCYGIDGNHDVSNSAWLRLCGINPLEVWDADGTPVPYRSADGVTMFGLNSYAPSVFRQKLKQLSDKLVGTLDVLLVHMPLSDMWNKGGCLDQTAVTAEEISEALADKGLRLVLLGDIHDYAETCVGGIRYVYPGSSEITASDERRDKGALLVEITQGEIRLERVPILTRPFLDLHVANDEDLENLLATVQAGTGDDGRDPITLITYDREVKGALSRISAILGDKFLFRALPARAAVAMALGEGSIPDMVSSFDRDAAIKMLTKVLHESFNTGSDVPAVVLELLEKPGLTSRIAEEYVRSKGVELRGTNNKEGWGH